MSKTAAEKKEKSPESENEEPRQPGTSTLEWIVAGVSLLLLVTVVAYLLVAAVTEGGGAAQIVVRPLGVTAIEERFIVEFAAENLAGQSVAGVVIKGELREGTDNVEEATVTLDYLPRNSIQTGALIFRNDPAGHELSLSATAYATP